MNIIVLGAGEIGRHIAISLSRVAHSIVVIEANKAIAEELEEKVDARVINANGTSVETAAQQLEGSLFYRYELPIWTYSPQITVWTCWTLLKQRCRLNLPMMAHSNFHLLTMKH